KLPWRFEWPAQWNVLNVDFEPFGKDHAEGSWPSGADITRNVLGDIPPVPMAYEWFTLDGKPFSSSEVHVIMVQDVLEFLEPEVLRYFFTKNPTRARDFSIERADQLVDEFDRFEEVSSGLPMMFVGSINQEEREHTERIYRYVVEDIDESLCSLVLESDDEHPIRLPYTFAAVLGMTDE